MPDPISTNPSTQPPAGPSPQPASPQPAAPPPQINLSVDEYQRFRALETQLGELQKIQQAAIDAKEQERLKALAEKDGAEKALAEQRKAWEIKHAEEVAARTKLEQQVFSEKIESTVASAFATVTFAGDTPEQKAFAAAAVRRELADDLEATRDAAGLVHVRQKVSGIAADTYLKEKLASPRYAGILAASKSGGTGAGGSQPGNGEPTKPPEPGSVADSVTKWMQSRSPAWGLHATQSNSK